MEETEHVPASIPSDDSYSDDGQSGPSQANAPEDLEYEETPILEPIPDEAFEQEAPAGIHAANINTEESPHESASEPPKLPDPLRHPELTARHAKPKGKLGGIIMVVILFGVGLWLSTSLRGLLPSGLPKVSVPFFPNVTPLPAPQGDGVVPTVFPTAVPWQQYAIVSGTTRQPVGVSVMVPPDVLLPICDTGSCESQGTYLPGGTRLTIAPRGAGQRLVDTRGAIITDVSGKRFTIREATVSGYRAREFTGAFSGTTTGGYGFTEMRGFMVEVTPTLTVEISHFTPSGIAADFNADDPVFQRIVESVSSGEKGGGTAPAEGKFCGGVAANLPENQCPTGYRCQLTSSLPDASGACVKVP